MRRSASSIDTLGPLRELAGRVLATARERRLDLAQRHLGRRLSESRACSICSDRHPRLHRLLAERRLERLRLQLEAPLRGPQPGGDHLAGRARRSRRRPRRPGARTPDRGPPRAGGAGGGGADGARGRRWGRWRPEAGGRWGRSGGGRSAARAASSSMLRSIASRAREIRSSGSPRPPAYRCDRPSDTPIYQVTSPVRPADAASPWINPNLEGVGVAARTAPKMEPCRPRSPSRSAGSLNASRREADRLLAEAEARTRQMRRRAAGVERNVATSQLARLQQLRAEIDGDQERIDAAYVRLVETMAAASIRLVEAARDADFSIPPWPGGHRPHGRDQALRDARGDVPLCTRRAAGGPRARCHLESPARRKSP